MGLFRPGTIRAMARGASGRRGRSLRMKSRIAAIYIFFILLLFLALCSAP